MTEHRTDIIVFSALLILTILVSILMAGEGTVDIQFHDTYIVLGPTSLAVVIIGPATFLIFLGRGLAKKFRTKGANIGLIIGLVLVALITYKVVVFHQTYLNEVMRLNDQGISDRGQFIVDTKRKIAWTWGLLGFWTVGLLLLIVRTVSMWKADFAVSSRYK